MWTVFPFHIGVTISVVVQAKSVCSTSKLTQDNFGPFCGLCEEKQGLKVFMQDSSVKNSKSEVAFKNSKWLLNSKFHALKARFTSLSHS